MCLKISLLFSGKFQKVVRRNKSDCFCFLFTAKILKISPLFLGLSLILSKMKVFFLIKKSIFNEKQSVYFFFFSDTSKKTVSKNKSGCFCFLFTLETLKRSLLLLGLFLILSKMKVFFLIKKSIFNGKICF